MYQIKLINMPFAALEFPSLALTQLAAVVSLDHRDRVAAQILYANHEFAQVSGFEFFQEIATSVRLGMTGMGDWLFRSVAFPELRDNTKEYFARCFPTRNELTNRFRDRVLRLREQVDRWLDEWIARHALDQADLVGLTSMFAQNLACIAVARKLKQLNPAVTIVLGGANCEFPMGLELARNVPSIDFVFSGPALKSFSEFVRHQLDGHADACHRMDGVFSKHNHPASSGLTIAAPDRDTQGSAVGIFGPELSVNELVPLDYDDFLSIASQWTQLQPALLFETSRGCWWGERAHCTFCGLNGLTMKYRPMTAELALRQFADLFRYASKLPRLTLQCVDNIMPREYLKDVLPHVNTPANVDIFYEVKSDLSEQDVAVLSAARVRSIQPGIESLATSTLKLMKKGSTAFQGLSLLKNCLRYDVAPQWNLLIGFPGETSAVYEKYERDLPLLYHLPPPTGAFPVRFDRYSPYFVEAKEYGLDLRPFDFYELIYPFAPESLQRLAYFFVDNHFDSEYFVQMVKWSGPLSALVSHWRSRYVGDDGGHRAELYLDLLGDDPTVVDTRDGTRREHFLNAACLQILRVLEKPLDKMRLGSVMGDTDLGVFHRELEFLQQRGLLFEEDGRYLSLVTRGDQNSSSSPAARFESWQRVQRIAST